MRLISFQTSSHSDIGDPFLLRIVSLFHKITESFFLALHFLAGNNIQDKDIVCISEMLKVTASVRARARACVC